MPGKLSSDNNKFNAENDLDNHALLTIHTKRQEELIKQRTELLASIEQNKKYREHFMLMVPICLISTGTLCYLLYLFIISVFIPLYTPIYSKMIMSGVSIMLIILACSAMISAALIIRNCYLAIESYKIEQQKNTEIANIDQELKEIGQSIDVAELLISEEKRKEAIEDDRKVSATINQDIKTAIEEDAPSNKLGNSDTQPVIPIMHNLTDLKQR
jgi:hypothetical protein